MEADSLDSLAFCFEFHKHCIQINKILTWKLCIYCFLDFSQQIYSEIQASHDLPSKLYSPSAWDVRLHPDPGKLK